MVERIIRREIDLLYVVCTDTELAQPREVHQPLDHEFVLRDIQVLEVDEVLLVLGGTFNDTLTFRRIYILNIYT